MLKLPDCGLRGNNRGFYYIDGKLLENAQIERWETVFPAGMFYLECKNFLKYLSSGSRDYIEKDLVSFADKYCLFADRAFFLRNVKNMANKGVPLDIKFRLIDRRRSENNQCWVRMFGWAEETHGQNAVKLTGGIQNIDELMALQNILHELKSAAVINQPCGVALACPGTGAWENNLFGADISREIRMPAHALLGMIRFLQRDGMGCGRQYHLKKAKRAARLFIRTCSEFLGFPDGGCSLSARAQGWYDFGKD
ncbi:MAG: hypothetical protein LBP78_05740 [Acidaminococcales bacterium]|jgi:hypothetical protein|nr:hypothetical protein [Acidaminococcales bacterium]